MNNVIILSSSFVTANMKTIQKSPSREEFKDAKFVNMGLWLSTLISLSIALLVTLMSALLGLLNTASNPKSTVFAVKGLFYWNGLAGTIVSQNQDITNNFQSFTC